MKLLIFSWLHEFTLPDILECLSEMGHTYSFVYFDSFQKDKERNEECYQTINDAIKKDSFDALFSINYFPDAARACHDNDLLYISWSYDCPIAITNPEETLVLPTNRAFFFDRCEYEEFKSKGIDTVYHLPLAVNSQRLSKVGFCSDYASEISFIGRVYRSSYPTLFKYMDEYFQGYTKALVEAQKNTYGAYLALEAPTDEFLARLNENFKAHNCPFTEGDKTVSRRQLAYSVASEATFENRLAILGLLSNKFDLKWYTYENSEFLPGIKRMPGVDYNKEMPLVFNSSKINLHIGLHAIPSGISLRQLDIMACGGFLLSSFQPELFDYFIPGEDFDYFTSPAEAYEKSAFYLTHEDTRSKIAASGRSKVCQYFDYKTIMSKLFETALA